MQKLYQDTDVDKLRLRRIRLGLAFLAGLLLLCGVAGKCALESSRQRTNRLLAKTVAPLEQTALYGLELGRLGGSPSRTRLDSLEKAYASTYLDSEDIRLHSALKSARRSLQSHSADSMGTGLLSGAFSDVVRKNGTEARRLALRNFQADEQAGWMILLVSLTGSLVCLALLVSTLREERSRKERERLILSLIESAPDAIVIFEPETGKILVSNSAAVTLFRLPSDAAGNMAFPLRASPGPGVPGSSTEERLAAIRRALAGEKVLLPWTFRDEYGGNIVCEARLSAIESSGRKLIRASFLDVTAREASQLALAASEARFRSLVENASLAIRISMEGKPVYVNNACVSMFGYEDSESLLGIPVRETYHPRTQGALDERIRIRAAGGTPEPEYDTVCLRRDGTPFHAHIWTTFEPTDAGMGIVGFLVDSTESVKDRESLARSEVRFRTLVNDASIAIRISCGDRMLYANQACIDLFGYPDLESFLAIRTEETYHSDDRERIAERFAIRSRGGIPPREYDGTCVKQDGTHFHVHVSTAFVNLEEGEAVVGFMVDTTETIHAAEREKLQREQLIHADRMASLGVLLAGMAHEINNPNNLALFNADLLGRILSDVEPILDAHHERNPGLQLSGLPYEEMKPEIHALVEGIRGGALRIRDIIGGLKDFARRNPISEHRPMDIGSVVQSSLLLVGNLVRKSTDRFETELASGLPMVRGDAQQLEQVVVNLLTNACQALVAKDRLLAVRTRFAEPDLVEIEVEDEGVGIPPENLPKILDPFFTTKREEGGTGLGLSVSWAIVQAHGGTLAFLPRDGGGTRAVIRLPIAKSEETT